MTPIQFTKKVARRLRYEAGRPIGRMTGAVIKAFDLQYLGQEFAPTVPKHYTPLPDRADFTKDYWKRKSAMKGIKIDDKKMIKDTENLITKYRQEFINKFPLHKTDTSRFHLVNGTYMAGDAHYYYALIRDMKPKRIIEIGSGASTVLAEEAIKSNMEEDTRNKTHLTAIEPFPTPQLDTCDKSIVDLRIEKLQTIDLSIFDELGNGDILFIDSTHVLKENSDVKIEFLEILPRLKKGVYVHVHDVSLPKPYPKVYFDTHLYWNEQYILQAYLTNNSHVEIKWAGTYLMEYQEQKMFEIFPEIKEMRKTFPVSEPSSFWFKTIKDAA